MANVSSINPESLRISSKCSSKILRKAKSATDGSSKSATLPPSALTAAISSINHEFIFSRWSARIPEDSIHVLLFHNQMSDQKRATCRLSQCLKCDRKTCLPDFRVIPNPASTNALFHHFQ